MAGGLSRRIDGLRPEHEPPASEAAMQPPGLAISLAGEVEGLRTVQSLSGSERGASSQKRHPLRMNYFIARKPHVP